MLNNLFGSNGAASAPQKVNQVSPKVTCTDLSPESICAGSQFSIIDDVFSGVVEITPQIATKWLERNENNFRTMNEGLWRKYADNMTKGQWEFNGESIKFDLNGNLIDGQHRLKACIESGKSFVTPVFYGVSGLNVDTGKPRNLEQVLEHEGFSEARIIAATLNKLHNYADAGSMGFKSVGHGRHVLTRADAVQYAKDNIEALMHSVTKTKKTNLLFNMYSLHSALHYLFANTAGTALADQFYDALQSGAGLQATSPVYHLREKLLQEKARKNEKLGLNAYAGTVIKAWNYWISGQEISQFRYNYEKEKVAKIKRSPLSK